MKTRAAVAWEAARPLEIEEVDLEDHKTGEVMVQVHASGLCRTDAYTLSGKDPEGKFPCILGHEGAGVVVEVGPGVRSVKPGDHVIPLYVPECGACKFCRSSRSNLCSAIRTTQSQGLMPDRTSRFSKNGRTIFHYLGTSTFSEYTVLPEISVARIRPDAPFEKICLLGCSITTGVGAVLNSAKVSPGSTVAVFGLGGVGLSVVQGAMIARAARIIGVDPHPVKRSVALQLGATEVLDPGEYIRPIHEVIIELTDGGVDYSFECVGNVELMRQALECCHRGWGESTIIGVAGMGEEITTRPFQLITGRVWRGSSFGGVRGRTGIPAMVDRAMVGEIQLDPYITGEVPLEDINRAFEWQREGKSIRTVIRF